ncbi:hypothetical protein [Serratia plymuthica]|uniref:hypothetical protein n=1 Tax=Serratia plymuthica TaxID=82996 RepID=UPI0020169B27|nr:hypothetical protein [Serratia plymuthica]
MPIKQVHNFSEAQDIIGAGKVKKIELAFDISADEFFKIANLSIVYGGGFQNPSITL